MTSANPALIPYSYVLDTSAIVAVLNRESGHDVVLPLLGQSIMSTVNWAEVVDLAVTGRLLGGASGRSRDEVLEALLAAKELLGHLGLSTTESTLPETELSGFISPLMRPLGLSLGDRACLSLGLSLNLPILTADRNWDRVDVGAQVRQIR